VKIMRALIACTLLFAASTAHAEGWRPEGATHVGVVADDHIEWHSTIAAAHEEHAAFDLRIELAVPLPQDVVIDGRTAASITAVRNTAGEIVAFDVAHAAPLVRGCASGRAAQVVHVFLRQPQKKPFGKTRLAAPIAAGDAAQQVILSRKAGLIFDADERLAFDRHVGFQAARSISKEDRDCLDELAGETGMRLGDERMYLRAGSSLAELGGITGEISPPPQHRTRVAIGAGISFIAFASLLAVAYARLGKRAAQERADAALAAEIEKLAG
jgi:hypothetical protein